jgi:hypothetical protein
MDSQWMEEFITFFMDSQLMEEFITFLGDCGIPETENDYQTNGSTPETSCNFNLDEVFDCPVPLVNLDPVWQKSPLSSFLGNGGIPETKANGGEAVQAEHLQSSVGEVRRQWTLFSPSESYAGCSKRPRTLGYNIEDAKRACHGYISAVATESQSNLNFSVSPVSSSENAGCSKGPSTVGSDENLPKNISAVATESESVSPVSSLVKNNSNCVEKQQEQYQLYRYQTGPSIDPQSIEALRRRKQNREKFRRLEKRITLRSKLDIAKMLEAAGKYVKFLEAQVHLLKSMSNGLGSARTLNPPTKKISLPMALE